ncbi:S-layer homology domain-containing protein [Butyricicoccus sp. AM78-15b2TA]|uniref:S-layer homology domain-containing protein n=1 Tax=Butyricicoccus sp. AM78-15b2TA TaxID=3002516 RepID=UPI0022E7246C|nr:S-layer homology domain-containing protein [Butyricicoccus sp. AM78-15b2TA]
MKRRLLSAFLAVMMVLTMAPVAFAADEGGTTGVAKIGDVEYPTLQAAVDAANNGDTIVLKKSISATEIGEKKQLQFVKADMNVTLDLNQNTITAEAGEAIAINAANITLTVKNGTIENFAEGNYSDGVYAYKESNNLTLTFESIVLKSRTQGLAVQGLTSNSNVNIVNSKITSAEELGIYYPPKSGTLTISDSEITGVTGIVVKGSNLVVKGEKTIISGTGPNVDPETYYTGATDGSSTLTETGDALYIESGYNDRDISVSISGGHLNSKSAKAVRMFVKNGENTSAKREISVTGGTFSSDVSAYVAEGYVQNENGTVEQLGETNAVAKVGNTYYKTLADAVAAAQSGETVKLLKNVTSANILKINQSITLDLGDYTFELTGSGNTARAIYINDGANVTIKANEKGGVKAATIALQVNAGGKLTIESGTYTGMYALALFSSDTKPAEAILNNGVFNGYIYTNGTGHDDHITFNGGTYNEQVYLASGDKSTYTISNGTFKNSLEIDAGRLDISGGTFTANIDTSGNANHPVTNNNGSGAYVGTLVVCKPDGSSATGYIGDAVVNITGGTFENTFANGETIVVADFGKEQENVGDAKVTISDNAKIKGVVKAYASENNTGMNFSITGGYFTTNPTDYVASGYVAGTSDVSGYSYKVVAKTETGNVEVKPAVAAPEVKVDKIPQKDQETVKAAAATVSAPTLGAAAVDEAQKIDKSKADELVAKANKVTGDKKLYVQSALKVEPTAYDETTKTLALEITPQYRVVASTADTADKIKLDGDTKNAQVVQDYQTMNITKATVVTMELPTGFAVADGDKLSIQHTKNGTVEYYTGTVTKKDDKLYLTFTTNGFSPFVISVPAASIGENVYPTLQAAADAAKSTDVISVKSGASHELNFTTTKSVKVKNDTGVAITVKFNGTNKDVAKDATETFSYTKPSSSSSGGSSSGKTTYKVTTSAVNNGGVNASPSNAEKGATITLTLSPDKGYKLDKLTVTDGSGKSVSTVKKSDTVYTFTMPASTVTVGVSYAKADETPSKTTFNDVSANDWFASAVDYVTGKGMMNGTADNTFSPKANTTRGMVVTVLYRLENQPSTSAASFTDVASGAYYANAVAWANANGIVSGYGSGKFGPNDKVTREQLAAMLYRYAQNKKYDVSGAKSLDGYTDAQSVSSYAVPALQWANAAGVVTGKSGSKLDPKGYATRAEVAAMLMRFCENVEK